MGMEIQDVKKNVDEVRKLASERFDSLLQYFKKTEHVHAPNAQQTAGGAKPDWPFRGTKGPLQVGYGNFEYPQSALWRTVAEKFGIPRGTDATDGEARSVYVSSDTVDPRTNTR